jgi:hypothetical protein
MKKLVPMLAAAILVGPAYAQTTHIPTCDAFMERLRTAGRALTISLPPVKFERSPYSEKGISAGQGRPLSRSGAASTANAVDSALARIARNLILAVDPPMVGLMPAFRRLGDEIMKASITLICFYSA